MADNTMIIVAVIAVLICICSSISGGAAFYMNQATPEETPETAGSPPPPAGSPPPPAASPPPPAGSPPPPAGVTCKADGTWSNNSPVPPGTVITRACPSGGNQTATCKADGNWDSDWQCSLANPGQAIKCTGYNPKGDGAIYRYLNNKKMSHYPNEQIADSWDPNWRNPKQIDCTGFTLAADMVKISPGDAIGCVGNEGYIQRYVGDKTIRGYPSMEIAGTWDPNWWNSKVIDCSGLISGPVMAKK